jgi:putative component of membrane protein insertase Oxa1/YidC/SpoIIIJ protein YidD
VKFALVLVLLLAASATETDVHTDAPWEPSPGRRIIVPGNVETYGRSSLLGSVLELSLTAYRFALADQQGDICAFYPSCSEYAEQALDSCGTITGLLMIADRLERCNWTAFNYAPRYYVLRIMDGRMVLRDPVRCGSRKRETEP